MHSTTLMGGGIIHATTTTTAGMELAMILQLRVLLAFAILFTTLMQIKQIMNVGEYNYSYSESSPANANPVLESILAFRQQQQQQQKTSSSYNNRRASRGYVDPLSSYSYSYSYSSSSSSSLPVPVQVMEQYKEWHSVDAIRRNPHNRTYAIGFYTCP